MQGNLKIVISVAALAAGLTACLEPQPAADIPLMDSTQFTIETIAESLSEPWSVTPLPGDERTYLITERGGALYRTDGAGNQTPISGLPTDIYVEQQAGLFDVVLAPDFETSREVFLAYAYGGADANGTALYKGVLNGDQIEGGETIFRVPPKNTASHFGGRIAFLPDNSLILTAGDGFVYREKAQELNSLLGKVYRLGRDGKPPLDNPFINNPSAKPEIYSYGHRNVQGLHYDAPTGSLWAHEHGPRGGDELNLILPGKNYGWPLATTGTDYNGSKITPFKTHAGSEAFIKDWVPSIAPSGLTIYRGDMFDAWNGDVLVGGLASHDLRRVDLENGRAVGEESLLADLDGRIRDVRLDKDGAILVVIDDPEAGRMLRIMPK